jgi:hypothetical protein
MKKDKVSRVQGGQGSSGEKISELKAETIL